VTSCESASEGIAVETCSRSSLQPAGEETAAVHVAGHAAAHNRNHEILGTLAHRAARKARDVCMLQHTGGDKLSLSRLQHG